MAISGRKLHPSAHHSYDELFFCWWEINELSVQERKMREQWDIVEWDGNTSAHRKQETEDIIWHMIVPRNHT